MGELIPQGPQNFLVASDVGGELASLDEDALSQGEIHGTKAPEGWNALAVVDRAIAD